MLFLDDVKVLMIKKTIFSGVLLAFFLLTACSQFNPSVTARSEAQSNDGTGIFQPTPKSGGKDIGELLYYLLVAEIAGKQGQLSVAVDAYQKATELSTDFRVARRAAQVAVYARKFPLAIKAAKRWIELQPDSHDAQQSLALLYTRIGKPEFALEQFIKLIEIKMSKGADAGNQELLRIGAMLRQVQHGTGQGPAQVNQQQALKVMSQLVEYFSGNPYALVAYSRLAFQFGDFQLANEKVVEALKLAPELDVANVLQANILMVQGKSEMALQTMEKVTSRDPENRTFYVTYARMLAEAGKYDKAKLQFEKLLDKSPDDTEILYALALLSIETRQYEPAESYLQRILKTGQRQSEAHFYLGTIAESRGDYDEAIQWFSKVDGGVRLIDAHIKIATLTGKKGNVDEALDQLRKLKSANANMVIRIIIAEIDILDKAKRFQEAMKVNNEAIERYPDNLSLYYVRSLLADRLNKLTLAEQDLRKILEKEPDNANALNALGYMLADRTDRYQEALGYVQRALAQIPDQPAYIDSMGWVQYRLGNLEEALRYLKKAFEIDQDSEIAAHLGEVLWQMGNVEEATLIWQRAQKKDPGNTTLKDVIERFKQ